MDEGQREVPTSILAMVAGLLVGLGLGAIAVLAWGDRDGAADPAPVTDQSTVAQGSGADTEAEGPPEPTDPATGVAGPSTMDRCADAAHRLQAPLEAAGPALEQWEVHIEAMNQLVVGEITLQQASDFWDRTRIGAQQRVDRFEAAWAAVRRQGVDCPSPLLVAWSDDAARPCARQVSGEIRVLDAARTSIRMWARHIRHMDLLRLGELSPSRATAMWLSMWKRGDQQLQDYRAAEEEQEGLDSCSAGASSGTSGTSAGGAEGGHRH